MINRDDIEAGDKCYTRDGGCLVARVDNKKNLMCGSAFVECWTEFGLFRQGISPHPLDIIRIEKAPKPVVGEVLLVSDDGLGWCANPESSIYSWNHIIKLTIINGKFDKAEQVK